MCRYCPDSGCSKWQLGHIDLTVRCCMHVHQPTGHSEMAARKKLHENLAESSLETHHLRGSRLLEWSYLVGSSVTLGGKHFAEAHSRHYRVN